MFGTPGATRGILGAFTTGGSAPAPLSSSPSPAGQPGVGGGFAGPATGGATSTAATATAGISRVAYHGEARATPRLIPAPLTRVITSIPDAMWVAIAALLALSLILAATTVLAAARAWRRDQVIRDMERMAFTDSLTGVLNRGALEQALARELARARRYGRPMSLLLLDVDHLKAVNDRHGHGVGDELLKSVGLTLSDSIRDHDICGRLGGDEYVVGVLEEGPEGAANVFQRIQGQVAGRRAELGLSTPWGVSVGMASYPQDGDTVQALLSAADRRLYASRGIDIEPS